MKKLAAQNKCKLKVVTGGTLARKAIKEQHPGAVIAIACERDLSLGIQDISAIPVLGILNRRPHGPCMNTDVDMNRVQTALNFFSQEDEYDLFTFIVPALLPSYTLSLRLNLHSISILKCALPEA